MNLPPRRHARWLLLFVTILSRLSAGPLDPIRFELKETPDAVIVSTDRYEATFSRTGAALTLRRGGKVVLRGNAASDPGGTFIGDEGKAARIQQLTSVQRIESRAVLDYGVGEKDHLVRLELQPLESRLRVIARPLSSSNSMVPSFSWELDSAGQWFGGGFQGWRDPQVWPLNGASVVKASFYNSAISQATPLWYTTAGVGVWVRTPVDFSYSVNCEVAGARDNLLRVAMPKASALSYDLLVADDLRAVVRVALDETGRPRRVPPPELFRSIVYTTWVEHKVPVDQAKVLEFARAIRANHLPAGVLELDDKWEARYGDMEFDVGKFPDPTAMVAELHQLGFRVTLWVHPFVNVDADAYADHQEDGLLVGDATGRPALIHWWNGPAAIWDFTDPRAGELFRRRLDRLMTHYGFDGFKFDGGDVLFVARDAKTSRPIAAVDFPDLYNAETTAHYGWNETRVGIASQPLGIVQRLIDKHSIWGRENGLAAIVPEAINTSLRGFYFVMPDMVGGNQYDNDRVDAELLIRWAQASALMPLLQFSVGPWHQGPDAVRLCREASELHLAFAPLIAQLAEEAGTTGEPILSSLVFQNPTDAATFTITDQFMLGRDIVVAPVVVKGAKSRDIYLPEGRWVDYRTKEVREGRSWVRAYPAPLDVLPIFVRENVKLP